MRTNATCRGWMRHGLRIFHGMAAQCFFRRRGRGVSAVPGAYLRGTDGSAAVRLGDGQPLTLSPDTRWALILDGGGTAGAKATAVDMVPTGAGDARRVLQGLNYISARWLPDGRRIVFQASEA